MVRNTMAPSVRSSVESVAAKARPAAWRSIVAVNDFTRILWVCRVSVASVLLGFLLVVFAVQARDLFLHVPATFGWAWLDDDLERWIGVALHSILLASLVFFLWALPVFYAARLAVRNGIWLLPASGVAVDANALEEVKARFAPLAKWVPRGLGFVCFLVILYAHWTLLNDLYDPETNPSTSVARKQLIANVIAVAVAAGMFVVFIIRRRDLYDATIGKMTGDRLADEAPGTIHSPGAPDRTTAHAIGLSIFTLLGAALVWLFFFPAFRLGFDREFLFPILLGIWVPPLYALTHVSYRVRLPLITLLLLAIVAFTYFRGDNHTVTFRAFEQSRNGAPEPGQQWQIDEAVALWAQANGCLDAATGKPGGNCPRPIIVTAEGGASRAAFMTATVLGTLMDATCDQPRDDIYAPCPVRPKFADRLFAISSVSGGAVGATMFSAALAAAVDPKQKDGPFSHACNRNVAPVLAFLPGPPRNWRDCLQALIAGDFLSPIIAGLFVRDSPFLHRGLLPDRQTILEDALVEHFDAVVAARDGIRLSDPLSTLGPRPGDWRPLLVLNGTSAGTGRRILTSHLAPDPPRYTTRSFAGGARIFRDSHDAMELFFRAGAAAPGERPACTRFADGAPIAAGARRDFPIVAAMSNSGRFPIISPPGDISCKRNDGSTNVIDRIVDGGYFDNFGASSAIDVAKALFDFELDPIVLLITNEPMDIEEADRLAKPRLIPRQPDIGDPTFVGPLTTPFSALYQTRLARGTYAMDLLSDEISQFAANSQRRNRSAETPRRVFHLAVHSQYARFNPETLAACDEEEENTAKEKQTPQRTEDCTTRLKPVSMSWWLSKPVQDFVDSQLPGSGAHVFELSPKAANIIKGRIRNHKEILALCDAMDVLPACEKDLGRDPETRSQIK